MTLERNLKYTRFNNMVITIKSNLTTSMFGILEDNFNINCLNGQDLQW